MKPQNLPLAPHEEQDGFVSQMERVSAQRRSDQVPLPAPRLPQSLRGRGGAAVSENPRAEDLPEPDDFDDYYYRHGEYEPVDPPDAAERAYGVEPR